MGLLMGEERANRVEGGDAGQHNASTSHGGRISQKQARAAARAVMVGELY